MPLTITFGGEPVEKLAFDIEKAFQISSADTLYVLNRQKSRMLQRTAQGRDLEGAGFFPYSLRGPYYYYPFAKHRQHVLDLRVTSVEKLFGEPKEKSFRAHLVEKTNERLKEFAKITKGQRVGRHGIKYPSYGAFKAGLGRLSVDLMGVHAPHMLQAIVVQARGPNEGVIGIYGEEGKRASGHNEGAPRRHLPKREFFGWGERDKEEVIHDLETMIGYRISEL